MDVVSVERWESNIDSLASKVENEFENIVGAACLDY